MWSKRFSRSLNASAAKRILELGAGWRGAKWGPRAIGNLTTPDPHELAGPRPFQLGGDIKSFPAEGSEASEGGTVRRIASCPHPCNTECLYSRSGMLTDHRVAQERWSARRNLRLRLPGAFGSFIASLALWDWFVTLTFRNALVPDAGISQIGQWLCAVERMAGRPIAYMLAEEFGRHGGRWHCHLLVTGVSHLRRDFWWREAYRRFGRARIEPFNPARGAAFYTAKYAAKSLGALHFGGEFEGQETRRTGQQFELQSSNFGGRRRAGYEVVRSDDVPKDFFRMGLSRWHR